MMKANIYVSDSEYSQIPAGWQFGQNIGPYYANEFSRACQEIGVMECTVYPFSELQKYPEIIRHFSIQGPIVVLLYDTDTDRAEVVKRPTQGRIVEAYNKFGQQGGGGVNPFTDGTGSNPLGLFKLPWWVWVVAGLLILKDK